MKTRIKFWVGAGVLFFGVGVSFIPQNALADEGLFSNFSISTEGGAWNFGKLGYQDANNNLNYNSLDAYFSGGLRRLNASGTPIYSAFFRSLGEIYIPVDGSYSFKVVKGHDIKDIFATSSTAYLTLKKKGYGVILTNIPGAYASSCVVPSCTRIDWRNTDSIGSISRGWYQFEFYYRIPTSDLNTPLKLSWIKPGSPEEIIPASSFSPGSWNNASDISIPCETCADEQMDFLTAGVGIGPDQPGQTNPNPELEIPLNGLDVTNIFKDDVWVFWKNEDFNENDLPVRNNHTGAAQNVSGTRMMTPHNNESPLLRGKIPASLVNDNGTGTLSFRFPGLDDDYRVGIALIIPFKDITKPFGKLTIKNSGDNLYDNASGTYVFNTTRGLPLSDAKPRPFFIMEGGESRPESKIRPSYISMRSGSGSAPGKLTFIANANSSQKAVPEEPGSPASGSDKWYPLYGREGSELDVLAMKGNYVRNLKYSGYAGAQGDGILDRGVFAGDVFGLNNTDTWVAFQVASSQLPEDGLNIPGSNESGRFMAIGMLTYSAPALPPAVEKLKICPNTSLLLPAQINVSGSQLFSAYYWSDYHDLSFIGDVCHSANTSDPSATNVTLSATWTSSNPPVADVDPTYAGPEKKFIGLVAGTADITASYTPPAKPNVSDIAYLKVNAVGLPCVVDMNCVPAETCKEEYCYDRNNCNPAAVPVPGLKDCSVRYKEE